MRRWTAASIHGWIAAIALTMPIACVGPSPLHAAPCDPLYESPKHFLVGDQPVSPAAGDFNGDGIADLAVADFASDSVSILIGTGGGGFLPAIHYPGGVRPLELRVEDFTGDDVLDIAVTRSAPGIIYLIAGNGAGGRPDGTFGTPRIIATGVFPHTATVADVNLDGAPDLVMACTETMAVMLGGSFNGRPDGTFGPLVTYATYSAVALAIADFNGDQALDVALANTNSVVNIYLGEITAGRPTGRFVRGQEVIVRNQAVGLVATDLDHDGITDLAIANGFLTMMLGNGVNGRGDGTFRLREVLDAGFAGSIQVFDFDGTGDADFLNQAGNYCTLLLADSKGPNGYFAAPILVSGLSWMPILLADVTGDGVVDLTTTGYGARLLSILPGTCAPVGPPAVLSVQPEGGSIGQMVKIDGYRFDGATGIRFGDAVAPILQRGPRFLRARVPEGARTARVEVLSPAGNETSPREFYVGALPEIASAEPSQGVAGTVITLTGSHFSAATKVRFAGRSVAAFVVESDQKILATVPKTAMTGPITVTNPSGDGTGRFAFERRPDPVPGRPTPPQAPLFETPFYLIAMSAWDCLFADFDRDGLDDFLAIDGATPTFSVHLNQGHRQFAPVAEMERLGEIRQTMAGRFDADASIDILIASDSGAVVLWGGGDGTFTEGPRLATGEAHVATGDLNGDGLDDIAVHEGSQSRVLLSRGDRHFSATTELRPGEGLPVIGTYDPGSTLDLAFVCSNSWGTKRVVVYPGDGHGGFALPITSEIEVGGDLLDDIVTGDFDNVAGMEIAFRYREYRQEHAVVMNQGDGSFIASWRDCDTPDPHIGSQVGAGAAAASSGEPLEPNHRPQGTVCIESADLDGDGRRELLWNYVYTRASVFTQVEYGDGPCMRLEQTNYSRVRAGDLDGDGRKDIVGIGYGGLAIRENRGNRVFGGGYRTRTSARTEIGVVADFNGDGRADVATGDGSAHISLAGADGRFQEWSWSDPPTSADGNGQVVAAHLNSDSYADLMFAGGQAWLSDGLGGVLAAPGIPDLGNLYFEYLAVADLNLDGHTDAVFVSSGETRSYLGMGDGSFQPAWSAPIGGAPCILADLDSDGRVDLLIGDAMAMGSGDGTFAAPTSTGAGRVVAASDFSGDGVPDLLSNSGMVYARSSHGFTPWHTSPVVADNPERLAITDFNGDGTLDIATVNGNSVFVALNDRRVGFVSGGAYGASFELQTVHWADITKDGRPDLVTVGYGGSEGMAGAITTLVNIAPINHAPNVALATPRMIEGAGSDGLATVVINGIVDPDGDPITTEALKITQDEPVTGGAADNTCPDASIDSGTARVRLESLSMGNGRTYAIQYVARDPRGGHTESVAYLCVPAGSVASGVTATCADDGQNYESAACGLNDVPLQNGLPLVLEYGIARATRSAIEFAVGMPGPAQGRLGIFDISGRRITEFDLACEEPCRRTVQWQTRGTAPGIYFTRLQSPFGTRMRTVVLRR